MKKLILLALCLLAGAQTSAFAQFQAKLKNSDVPKLKCSDELGGYYVFYSLKGTDERGSFAIAFSIHNGPSLGYEMVTTTQNLQDPDRLLFSMYDPITAIRDHKKTIYQLKVLPKQMKLILFSKSSGKTYEMACTVPVKDVDYD